MFEDGSLNTEAAINNLNLWQENDTTRIKELCTRVINNNKDTVCNKQNNSLNTIKYTAYLHCT